MLITWLLLIFMFCAYLLEQRALRKEKERQAEHERQLEIIRLTYKLSKELEESNNKIIEKLNKDLEESKDRIIAKL